MKYTLEEKEFVQQGLAPLYKLGANFSKRNQYPDYTFICDDLIVKIEKIDENFFVDNRFFYRFYINEDSHELRRVTVLLMKEELPSFIFDMRYLGYLQYIDFDLYNTYIKHIYGEKL